MTTPQYQNPFDELFRQLAQTNSALAKLSAAVEQLSVSPTKRKPIIGAKAIAEHIGVAESTIYKLTANGELPHAKRGKKLTADPDELDAWMLKDKIYPQKELAAQADIYSRRRNRKAVRNK